MKPHLLSVLSVLAVLLQLPRDAGAQPCAGATVWTSPQVVPVQTVLPDREEHGPVPNYTAFIELLEGSASEIDPRSVTLNGVPAIFAAGAGDGNGNGIDDLMVKFDRSALVTTDGVLEFAGTLRSGRCFSTEMVCRAVGVERSDYFLNFLTANTTDSQFDRRRARLNVHRVAPVFPRGCPNGAFRAAVLVHGLTILGTVAFDLQYRDYSLMESLAMRGIDTFAVNHLGFGPSQILRDNPLDDPCNASLPQCPLVGSTCTAVPGVCDCANGLANPRLDQQGSTRYLNPNPLGARCPHTTENFFQRVTDQEEQLDWVVDDALRKTGLEKVYLLSLSLGGSTIGRYLGVDVSHKNKIAGAIFVASTFGGVGAPSPTWPLGLSDRADAMANFNLVCPGQQDAGMPDALWTAVQAQDPLGSTWGPGGLSRYPIVPRFGWGPATASNIQVPALVLHGRDDTVARLATTGTALFNALTVPDKTFEVIPCASHGLLWETCAGENCVDPHKTVQKRAGDWILRGGRD